MGNSSKKLKKIKVGDKTLGEVLGEIAKKDPSFGEKIESFTTMTDLAEFLLQSTNPELQPFKKAIRELKEKHMEDEAQGGVAVSGLEMSQNAQHYKWSREEVDQKLHGIMKNNTQKYQ